MKYIYHHLGLGDHIICNGLVRFFKEEYGKVGVFSKHHNLQNVKYMYRDDTDIEVIGVAGDGEVNDFLSKINEENFIMVGFGNLTWRNENSFDDEFYTTSSIPFEYRFSKFGFLRDSEKESEVYDYLNPYDEKYIFTHGEIDKSKIRNDLKIIQNPHEFNLFDILKIIERAEEVHLMESSVKCLVNSYKFSYPKFFYHQYVRGYDEYLNSKGYNDFKTIY